MGRGSQDREGESSEGVAERRIRRAGATSTREFAKSKVGSWVGRFPTQVNQTTLTEGMTSFDFTELLSLVQTIAIIVALLITLYFSQRQIRASRVDLETRVLNELDEKFLHITGLFIERPELFKLLNQRPSSGGPVVPAAGYILDFCYHIFHMRQRGTLNDNDWGNWLRWMRMSFQFGSIAAVWRAREVERWFDPAFREFVELELLGGTTTPDTAAA